MKNLLRSLLCAFCAFSWLNSAAAQTTVIVTETNFIGTNVLNVPYTWTSFMKVWQGAGYFILTQTNTTKPINGIGTNLLQPGMYNLSFQGQPVTIPIVVPDVPYPTNAQGLVVSNIGYFSITNLNTVIQTNNVSTSDAHLAIATNASGFVITAPGLQPASTNLTNWSALPTSGVQPSSANLSNYAALPTTTFQPANTNLTNWSTVAPANFQPASSSLSNFAQLTTNVVTQTNDTRTLTLTNAANQFGGFFSGNGAGLTNVPASAVNTSGLQAASSTLTNWSNTPTNTIATIVQLNLLGAADTNLAQVLSTNATNFTLTTAASTSNFALTIGAAASNNLQHASSTLSNWSTVATNTVVYTTQTTAVTITNAANAIAGNISGNGAGLTNIPLAAVNVSTLQVGSATLTNLSTMTTNQIVTTNQASAVTMTNIANHFTGVFAGDGSSLTNISGVGGNFQPANANLTNIANLTTNQIVTTNQAPAISMTNVGNVIVGSFTGNGAGLTNIPQTSISGAPFQPGNANLTNLAALAAASIVTTNSSNAVVFTNVASAITGTFTGNGAGLTNLSVAGITNLNTMAFTQTNDARPLNLSNATNTVTGTFTGNGAALTNLNVANIPALNTNALMRTNESRVVTFVNSVNFGGLNAIIDNTGFAVFQNLSIHGSIGDPFAVDSDGNVTASTYLGDGSGLTGITPTQVGVNTNILTVTNDPRALKFTNAANTFAGTATLSGTFNGNGGGLTNIPFTSVTGSATIGQLPASVMTSNYTSAVSLTNVGNGFNGAFTGNGNALTNIPLAAIPALNTNAFTPSLNGNVTNLTTAGTNQLVGVNAYPEYTSVALANGNNAAINLGTNTFINLEGNTAAATINGLAGGISGRVIEIMNTNGFAITVANDSGGDSTFANRIYTPTGGDLVSTNKFVTAELIWSASLQHWVLERLNGAAFNTNYTGTFTGNGSGLTNVTIGTNSFVPASQITGTVAITNGGTGTNSIGGFVTTNASPNQSIYQAPLFQGGLGTVGSPNQESSATGFGSVNAPVWYTAGNPNLANAAHTSSDFCVAVACMNPFGSSSGIGCVRVSTNAASWSLGGGSGGPLLTNSDGVVIGVDDYLAVQLIAASANTIPGLLPGTEYLVNNATLFGLTSACNFNGDTGNHAFLWNDPGIQVAGQEVSHFPYWQTNVYTPTNPAYRDSLYINHGHAWVEINPFAGATTITSTNLGHFFVTTSNLFLNNTTLGSSLITLVAFTNANAYFSLVTSTNIILKQPTWTSGAIAVDVFNNGTGLSEVSGGSGLGLFENANKVATVFSAGNSPSGVSPEIRVEGNNGMLAFNGTGGQIVLNNANSQFITSGTGSPNSVVTAPVGSLYSRNDGGSTTTLYVKESGTGNTGWVAK